jgi:putative ABC transport system permease protein
VRAAENLKMALKNLRNNKARSFLTMLGIIIGVGAVITMVSLGEGAKNQITQRISEIGSNLIIVSPGREDRESLDKSLVDLLEESSDWIASIAPTVSGGKTAEADGYTLDVSVIGCTPEYEAVRNPQVASGDFITAEEVAARRRVAVIGANVAKELLPGKHPIGEEIKVGSVRFEVIGVLEEKGQGGFGNIDNQILIPLTTAQERIFGQRYLSEISIQAQSAETVDIAYTQIQQTLMDELEDDDLFRVSNMADMLSAAQDMTGIMTMLLAGIAAISLLVGGIGIMNIMLVSVTERIREIGIRKAIGAQPEEILMLFLIEAVTLGLLGGVAGIVWGGGLAMMVGKMLGWTITISIPAVMTAFIFSMAVGLFFGVYPAYKASRLNPIEALRHE